MKRRKNIIPGVIILTVGFLAVAGAIIYAISYSNAHPNPFYHDNRNVAKRLYDEVLSYDLDNAYPESAEEVMYINNMIRRLYYGKLVANEDYIRELTGIQRKLFTDELLENNSFDSQYEKTLIDMATLYDNGVYIYNLEAGPISYDSETGMCVAPITETLINYDKQYWNYFLTQNDLGQWKIYTWQVTDMTFRVR